MYKTVSLHCIQDVHSLRYYFTEWTGNTFKLYMMMGGGNPWSEMPDQPTPPPHPAEKKTNICNIRFRRKLFFCQHQFGPLMFFGGWRDESFCSVKRSGFNRKASGSLWLLFSSRVRLPAEQRSVAESFVQRRRDPPRLNQTRTEPSVHIEGTLKWWNKPFTRLLNNPIQHVLVYHDKKPERSGEHKNIKLE